MTIARRLPPLLAIAASLSTLLLAGCTTPATDSPAMASPPFNRTVLITRHAEKQRFSADPSLSERGAQRAEALSRLPEAQAVTTIITTQFRRAVETALPLADRLGIEPRIIPATARPDALRAMASDIRASAANGTVLVVGHSNTVPMVIAALGGPDDIFLAEETDFGDLFVLTLDADGNFAGIERGRYGD